MAIVIRSQGKLHRFFCPHLVESGLVTLAETEAHHLVHVLRHESDDIVELFNGEGLAAKCRISAVRKRDVELEIQEFRRDAPAEKELTLASAVPKGDRFDWLIEKATELGVTRLIPLTSLRSIVDPRTSKLDKLRQTVITACKQSGRNTLMEIASVTSWSDMLQAETPSHRVLIAHPQGESLCKVSESILALESRPLLAAIGPEGGFSEEEVDQAAAVGAEKIQLGPNILRIETAAIAIAARLLI